MNPLEKLLNYDNPEENVIPNINLYMDQLMEYFEITLGDLKRQDEDAVLTKTMINNYVKSSLIKAPERKKYDKETISDLIIIYHLKKAFSIQDTTRILAHMKSDKEYYAHFVNDQNTIRKEIIDKIPRESFELTQDEAQTLLHQLVLEVSIKKQLAEQLIDYLSTTTRVQK